MQGQLFSQDFLHRGIRETPPWLALDEAALQRFTSALRAVFAPLSANTVLNEAQTEQLVIERVLVELGWGDDYLPQVNLSGRRREDVPDVLLFPDAAAKAAALAEPRDDKRYRHGLAILEAKRWLKPLDRGDPAEVPDPDAPSSQMLRYLSRVDVVSDRSVKWGVLTNGALWRLYWQDARSRAEEFFEIDLATALRVPGSLPGPDEAAPEHTLKLFFLLFNRAAFLTQTWDSVPRSFHAHARHEARLYEERVSQDLGRQVFEEIFPRLAEALARGDLQAATQPVGYGSYTRRQFTAAYLDEVREATLVLLYRLLFLFYAEDRLLLPARDPRYAPYSVRGLRERVRDAMEAGRPWSSTIDHLWRDLRGVFELVNTGDDAVGMPAYNGGLFDRARAPLLERTRVPDKVMAPIIDRLSRRTDNLLRLWINYRDLSVSHLGSIYERLLEYSLVHEVQAAESYHDRPEIDRLVARPASFARKASGSYYTHDDLVRLLLEQSVGRLAQERVARFQRAMQDWKSRATLPTLLWNRLDGTPEQGHRDSIDPASQLLELTICDPAMGSGHFLVALVDDLADRVLEAASMAAELVNRQPWAAFLAERGRPWVSPVVQRIAAIRASIRQSAHAHGWAVSDAQLDDRHIVRRMILKKCVFGVDKNPMAVELAKTALWLHTFTVGAPLSFLDHHLKLGDSLHGERLDGVRQGLESLGMLFSQSEMQRLVLAAQGLSRVADLTDADIAEARESRQLAEEATARTAPLHALLDFWRALRWRLPGWPAADARRLGRLGDEATRTALDHILAPGHNLLELLVRDTLAGEEPGVSAANALLADCRRLAAGERFFHWWTAFPTVFDEHGQGGFDIVLGNPPWDRIKLQEVEWLAEREPAIATQPRAADRRRLVADLQRSRPALWAEYQQAVAHAEANARVLGKAGDYPLLGGGDLNLYSLFVERAQALVKPEGIVALLTPSGIAADKGAAAFFRSISTTGRLGALFDFENRKVFFPDVDSRFKFTALVFGGDRRQFDELRCAFYLHAVTEIGMPDRCLVLDPGDFALLNPNTGAAPVFRHRRDADITTAIYRRHPVLVKHGITSESLGRLPDQRQWSVRYTRVFDMTNDSGLFLSAQALAAAGFRPTGQGRWQCGEAQAVPLYVGRMVHQYDHRHASVTVNEANLLNAASGAELGAEAKASAEVYPTPQYWVRRDEMPAGSWRDWAIGFRDIARATDARTMIAAFVPGTAAGNTLPLLLGEGMTAAECCLLLANLNALVFDFVARQKAQSTHLNWYIVEQLPVIAPATFAAPLPPQAAARLRAQGLMNGHHAQPTVADFVVPQVLALSYTAHDLAPLARELGYVDASGSVLPPVRWDEEDRRQRLAALDAVFMHLYGLAPDDAAHVLDSFPIVREHDRRRFGRHRTAEDVLAWLALMR